MVELTDGQYFVRVIADNVSKHGHRLRTIVSRFPRIILSEVNTHRDRARNAASSRAIPFPVMISEIEESPFVPLTWGLEKKGMQQGDEIPVHMRAYANNLWLASMRSQAHFAKIFHCLGKHFVADHPDLAQPGDEDVKVHKSICNRLVEPWMWCTQVMTATEWQNFFRLRCHRDAEQHFQKIAGMIRDAFSMSIPEPYGSRYNTFKTIYGADQRQSEDQFHLPFIQPDEIEKIHAGQLDLHEMLKVCTARCARVSYLTHDGKRDMGKDIDLFNTLVQGSGFGHWSPHEHVAQASEIKGKQSGPFVGWDQYRKYFPNECALEEWQQCSLGS